MAETGQPTETGETTVALFEAQIGGEKIPVPEKIKVGDREVSLKDLITRSSSGARKEAEARMEKKLAQLRSELDSTELTKKEIEERLQKIEEENMTASEKAAREIEKSKKKWETDVQTLTVQAQTATKKYHDNLIRNEIRGAFGGFELYNPEQTALLVQAMGQPKVVETDGTDRVLMTMVVDGEAVEMAPKEFVQKYLAMPGNENQLRATVKPGAGSSQSGARRDSTGGLVFTRKQLQDDPAAQKEYRDALLAGKPARIEE